MFTIFLFPTLLIIALVTFWQVSVALIVAVATPFVIRSIRRRRFYTSERFSTLKASSTAIVAEHNDVAVYTSELFESGSFRLESTLSENCSNLFLHNYSRCSLEAVHNSMADPAECLISYHNINIDETGFEAVEMLGDDTFRLERAVANLREREADLIAAFAPPAFVVKSSAKKFLTRLGMTPSRIETPYPSYTFEYIGVSAKSSLQTTITQNMATIDALIYTLFQKVRSTVETAAQRVPMTVSLRAWIMARDDYTCRQCSSSTAADTRLLLEVVHIIPVSMGGLSTTDNLQTLCWRCARAKRVEVL